MTGSCAVAIPKWLTMPIFCQNKEKKLAIIRQQIGRFRFRILFLLRSANINHYVLQNLAHSENLGFHSFGKSRWNDPVPMHERDDLNTRCYCLPFFSSLLSQSSHSCRYVFWKCNLLVLGNPSYRCLSVNVKPPILLHR